MPLVWAGFRYSKLKLEMMMIMIIIIIVINCLNYWIVIIIMMMMMMMMINYLNFSLFMHCLSFRELLLQTEKLGIWNLLIIGSVKGKRVWDNHTPVYVHNNNYLKNNLSHSLLIEVCLFPTNPEIPMLYFLTTQNLLLSQWMVRRLRRRSHWTAEFKVRGCDRIVNCQNSQWSAPGNTISLVNKQKLNKQTNKPVKNLYLRRRT